MLFEKKNHFVLVNGVDPDEMKHYAVFNVCPNTDLGVIRTYQIQVYEKFLK